MRRAYGPLELRIDGKHVTTQHMIGWTKPGTPLDRVAKAQRHAINRYLTKAGLRKPKVHQHRREIARNMSRLPDDGYGRVHVAQSVTGLSAAYTG